VRLGCLPLAGLVLVVASPAFGQQHPTVFQNPLGYQQYTSLASATPLTGIPARATLAQICAEAQPVRWRDDGVAPTATVGMLIAVGSCINYTGKLTSIQFIQATAGGILNISFYQ
jgi:hypothetical protein